MDNGTFGTQDILTGRGLGLGGFGGYNYGQFAGPSSNAVRINRNLEVGEANDRCTKQVLGAGLDRISAQNFEGRFNAAVTSIRDGQFQSELRNGDRLRDIEREIAQNARVAAECCCELKLENCKNTAMLSAEIKAVEGRNIERSLNAANAELIALRTQVACGCVTGCSTPCTSA